MKEDISSEINCADCQETLLSEWITSAEEHICPKCGSLNKIVTINIVESVDVKESISGKVKDQNYSSKKNPRYEFFNGDDLRKNDDKWMEKSRVIDKRNDIYKETVMDPETGEVVHHKEEPLSEHFGHGYAKFKIDNDKNS